jgi:hypothetical protein
MASHRIYAHVDLNLQTRQLLKMLCGWRRATTALNIISGFQNGGIIGEWNAKVNALVHIVDRVAASQRRRWNGSKERVDISLALG